jgi:hypothetical protein
VRILSITQAVALVTDLAIAVCETDLYFSKIAANLSFEFFCAIRQHDAISRRVVRFFFMGWFLLF